MSLRALRLQNLRCLVDTGWIPMKPITLLVGRNSSGKSTFLRAFPLLRQSVESARRSPILWRASRGGYVDFGSIREAINKRASPRSVSFGFSVGTEERHGELIMTLVEGEQGARIQAYDLTLPDSVARLEFDVEGRVTRHVMNGSDVPFSGLALTGRACLVPAYGTTQRQAVTYQPHNPSSETIFDGFVALGAISTAVGLVDARVSDFMSRVAYLAPQRAVGDRLYLRTEAAVDEVHPRGENMPDFLSALSEADKESLSAFTRKHLGFEVRADVEGSDVQIVVKEAGAAGFVNIADVGFGYAEVLPLCAALWSSCVRDPGAKRLPTSLLAIEQPELHLHPAHQVKLADLLVGAWRASRDAGREVELMVETHSEGIVNRMGDLIEQGLVAASDVQILFFDQDPDTRETQVRLTGYTADGALNDKWPFGFFAPVAD